MDSYTIKNLTFSYPQQERKVLNQLSFSISAGEFVTLCGPSGCGKTTLLRQLKTMLAPHGEKSGEILFEGQPLNELDQRAQSSRIGFVMQSPDNQIVTDKVWHELAFGLESLGMEQSRIRLRVAEMASFFGIQAWFYKDISELSGGQKQLLNLASIMAMQPSVLILDEPTSQLDPIAAGEFLATVGRINRELGVTVILTEHRLEEVFPLSNRVLVLDEGRLICDGTPEEVGRQLKDRQHGMFFAMPAPMRIYAGIENDLRCPVTVREGRNWLNDVAAGCPLGAVPPGDIPAIGAEQGAIPGIELDEVWFRYEKTAPDVVKGLSLKAYYGEFCAVLGGNGTGKTTALSLLSGINKPHRGEVRLNGRKLSEMDESQIAQGMLGVLPQNPQALFVRKTVEEDLFEMLSQYKLAKEEKALRVKKVARLCRLEALLQMHPYDLSGGEQQRAALAKVLLLEPKILLLDEPTKGLDAEFKREFAEILHGLLQKGVAILMVSHDIEFCARYAHRCALFFDGHIVSWDTPRQFFSGNSFYTTAANRMARHKLPEAITPEDVIAALGGDVEGFELKPADAGDLSVGFSSDLAEALPITGKGAGESRFNTEEKPWGKKLLGSLASLIFLAAGFFALGNMGDISAAMAFGGLLPGADMSTSDIWRYVLAIVMLGLSLVILYRTFLGHKAGRAGEYEQMPVGERHLSKRTWLAMALILLAIPLTIYIGVYYFGDRKYYFISLLIIIQTMLPFLLVFESREPQARELIVIAVLCAIAVAGRAAFFMLPQFKPVLAMVIISGVAFGAETGFLVGAMTAFVSNIFFGQGPWTPWQMFAFGIIGFFAGLLFQKGLLRRNILALCSFGAIASILIYGGIMNPAAVLMFQNRPTVEMFLLAYLRGFPFDLVHAIATVVFLLFMAKPMLEKLDRIKLKYGLIESPGSIEP